MPSNWAERIEFRMIALQEELDWQVYRLYGLLEDPLEFDPDQVPEVALGERPFEIALARKMAAGEIETKWFERHGSTPITEIPDRWPEPYRRLIEKRLKAIEENPWIRLIEQPEYKRRWNREPWEEQEKRALRSWLLDRLEDRRYWPEPPQVTSAGRLADRLRQDDEFRQVATLYRGRNDFDWTTLVTELVAGRGGPLPRRLALRRLRKAQTRRLGGGLATSSGMEDAHRRADDAAGRRSPADDRGRSQGREGEGGDRRAAALRLGRLPQGVLLAPAGQAGRAEGTLHPLSRARAGGRSLAGDRLGGVGPSPAGPGSRHRLPSPARGRGLGRGPPRTHSRRPPGDSSPGFSSGTTSPIPPMASDWGRTSRPSSTKRPARWASPATSSPRWRPESKRRGEAGSPSLSRRAGGSPHLLASVRSTQTPDCPRGRRARCQAMILRARLSAPLSGQPPPH